MQLFSFEVNTSTVHENPIISVHEASFSTTRILALRDCLYLLIRLSFLCNFVLSIILSFSLYFPRLKVHAFNS